MSTRLEFVRAAVAALALPSAAPSPLADARAEAIFRGAKDAWRGRSDLPYLTYAMRERYTWRDRPHETWWHAWFRLSDHRIALQRMVIAQEERDRLKGSAISIHMRFHQKNAPASFDLDTNPNADAFDVLDPMIDPIGSFGMLRTANATLAESDAVASPAPLLASPLLATPAARASAGPATASSDAPFASAEPLHELARVEAITRDYRITYVGSERIRDRDAGHLVLVPLRDPYRYRLRDLWIATDDAKTLQLATHGLFVGAPYDTARWIVSYVEIDGRMYVQEISSPDTLRFKSERAVTDFAFDFVGYGFPASIPNETFAKLL